MKKVCGSMKEQWNEIDLKKIGFEMKLLTNEEKKSYDKTKVCYIWKEKFKDKYIKDKRSRKARDDCHDTDVNAEVYVIQSIVHLKIFLKFFVMDLTMIIILS